jgi:crossover junction endodeoxyribonuclease RusA
VVPSLPWDFTVIGTPASAQAKGPTRRRWQQMVAAAAVVAWPVGESPFADKLEIHVTCYHDSAAPLDVDNMLKPIQDALIGIVYVDDDQLTATHGYLRDINLPYEVRGMTAAQAHGFVSNEPFVHVRIETPSSTSRLP